MEKIQSMVAKKGRACSVKVQCRGFLENQLSSCCLFMASTGSASGQCAVWFSQETPSPSELTGFLLEGGVWGVWPAALDPAAPGS